ncbi:unnamed protein product [marine sediment metagenome]|uniref:Uncharacterized protein n=1 Tax=marine sediment metagenome TaxID=412755 RepID=X1JK53_9ZZZZ
MNAWKIIDKVITDLTEAKALAKDGNKTTACCAMNHAAGLLKGYIETSVGPEHGFEDEEKACQAHQKP